MADPNLDRLGFFLLGGGVIFLAGVLLAYILTATLGRNKQPAAQLVPPQVAPPAPLLSSQKAHSRRLSVEKIGKIHSLIDEGKSFREVAATLGVSPSTIWYWSRRPLPMSPATPKPPTR